MSPRVPLVGHKDVCPHCGVSVQFVELPQLAWIGNQRVPSTTQLAASMGTDLPNHNNLFFQAAGCPNCGRTVVAMLRTQNGQITRYVWPEGVSRRPIPTSLPPHIAEDYREAVLVLPYSPKASAALSRRCLQHLLREQGFAQHDLVKQISAAEPTLPQFLRDDLDVVRVIGNFAAHPMKSETTGAILGVDDRGARGALRPLLRAAGRLEGPTRRDQRQVGCGGEEAASVGVSPHDRSRQFEHQSGTYVALWLRSS